MKAPPRSFGDLLRQYRVAAGITQETLADRARMSLAAVGKLERGMRQRPYRATIALLAEALSLSPDDRHELERAARRAAPVLSPPPEDAMAAIRLPAYLSSFVGREGELAEVCEMLASYRLVTLVGIGGVGKTRLAVRAAEQFIALNPTGERFDGVWFVDLSPISDDAMIAMAFAAGIGVDGVTTIDALVAHLRSQTFLLILDNCEHLLDAIARTAKTYLSSCPGARILATSRQAFSLEGERVYNVPPLPLPDAIRLFKDRAEGVDSRFELTEQIVAAVSDICQRVDGIALAIELAAARTNAFSAASIAAQIGEHFSLLSGGLRGALPRHQTMRSLFDWSYDLLDSREQDLFLRSSIFAGGFTLDLLCGLYELSSDKRDIPLLLASLVDKSLVQSDIHLEPTRYHLLEPARQYAREKLSERNEYDGAARAHAIALLALAEAFDSRLDLIPDREWDDYIERERDNFRAAFEWSFGPGGDMLLGQRLAASRTATWGGFKSGEIRRFMCLALAAPSEATPRDILAKLATNAARTAVYFERDPEAKLESCRRALALQLPGDLRGVASAHYFLGVALGTIGRYDESDAVLRQARECARSSGGQYEYNIATVALGTTRFGAGDLPGARELVSEALQQSEAALSDRDAADASTALADIEFASGNAEEALRLNKTAAQFFVAHSDLVILPKTLSNSAAYLIALGRYDEAWGDACEALHRSQMFGSVVSAFWAMQHLAAVAILRAARNEDATLRRAAKVLGFVDNAIKERGKLRFYTEQQVYDTAVSALREVLGPKEVTKLILAGEALPEEQAVAEAFDL